jgi:integrase/recombinase XerD
MDADAGTLIPTTKRNSLIAWFNLYMGIEAGDADSNTFKAKQSDLSRFINYFRRVTGSDHPDQWTRSVSQGFLKELLRAKSDRTGRKIAPTTVNRVLATLRNTARWIHRQRSFVAGYPMDRVSDVTTPEPEWKGLDDVDVTRLKAAAEQLLHIHTRLDQNALRDKVILLVMLDTAFRVSELVSLDLEQYQGKHFTNVKRKGNHVTDRVFVGQAAREALDHYLADVRGHAPGPLFQSKRGRRLAPQNVADALGQIRAEHKQYGGTVDLSAAAPSNWKIDAGTPYPHSDTANPCSLKQRSAITMNDMPNALAYWRGISNSLVDLWQRFQTCVVCLGSAGGSLKGKGITVYGCVSWEHRIYYDASGGGYVCRRSVAGIPSTDGGLSFGGSGEPPVPSDGPSDAWKTVLGL